jgi:hypothetical protein
MNELKQYLEQYKIDPVTLSTAAGVRYVTVWNATKGNPITPEKAKKIKEAVLKLTGIAYTGPLALIAPPTDDQFINHSYLTPKVREDQRYG